MEHNVVNSPRRKMRISPIFFPLRTLSFSSAGIGMTATTTSDMMVMMAYAVNEGPGDRHVPGVNGFHDLLTCTPCEWHVLQERSRAMLLG